MHSELPSNLLLKHLTPTIWLPLLTALWGVITMCLGFVKNFAGFAGVRALLGLAEGGLLPGMVLYLSGMYTRGEMAVRVGVFYTAASLSGAFGGRCQPVFPVLRLWWRGVLERGRSCVKTAGADSKANRSAGERTVSNWAAGWAGGLEVDFDH